MVCFISMVGTDCLKVDGNEWLKLKKQEKGKINLLLLLLLWYWIIIKSFKNKLLISGDNISTVKMINYKYIFSFLFLIMIVSCVYDPPMARIEIVNQSNETILFDLYFDSVNYQPYWKKPSFQKFLTYEYGHSYSDIYSTLISVDTVNLIQYYKIPSGATYSLDGWGDRDEDVLYRCMRFFTKSDTIEFNDIESIKSSFKRIDKYINRLILE